MRDWGARILAVGALAVGVSLSCVDRSPTSRPEQVGTRRPLTEVSEAGRKRVWALYVSARRRQQDIRVVGQRSQEFPSSELIPPVVLTELRGNRLTSRDLPGIIEEGAARQWADSAGCRYLGNEPIRQHPYIYPPSLKRMPPAKYTEEACVGKIHGVVIVQLTIDREGRAGEPTAVRGLPGGLTESAIEALRASEFWPALLCGSPVPVHTTTTVTFELPPACG
jgi:hypothetical protein